MKSKQALVPKLRFNKFEEGWNITSLGELCQITTGKLDANAMRSDGKYRFYTCAKSYYQIDKFAFDTEALLISGNGANVGYIHYYKGKFNAYQRTYVLDQFEENITYVQYLLQDSLKSRIDREKKAGNTPYIVMGTLTEMSIPLPSLPEQEKIAGFLTSVDDRIDQLKRKKSLLQDYKKGVMQKLFSQELRFKDDNGKPYPDWEVKKVAQFADCCAGGTPRTTKKEYWGGSIRWMNSGELNLKTVHEVEGRITDLGLKESSTKLIPAHCILIGLAGQGKTRGTVAHNTVSLCTNQSIAAILPSSNYYWGYLYHNLDFRYEELRRLSTGDGGRGGLNLSIIRNLTVYFPTLNEQTKIANFLSTLDQKIEQIDTQITQTQTFKKGLLQQMFV